MNDFFTSMPPAYGRTVEASEITEHARIVERRGSRVAHAESCQIGGAPAVLLVVDDRPGLLSLVTDALLVQGLSVRKAQAYSRKRADGRIEAIDFMQLQRPKSAGPAEVDDAELAAFVQALTELISEDVPMTMGRIATRIAGEQRTRVYFDLEALARREYLLSVEAPDSQGLLHAITSALYAHGVRIFGCYIDTEAGFARARFELGLTGIAPTSANLCDIQLAVLSGLPRRS